MPKSPDTTTIVKTANQHKVTIPKPIVEALRLQPGQKVKWKVKGAGKLEIEVKK